MILDTPEKLYKTYFMKIYSYVLNIVKNSFVAEEITQNAFVKALTANGSYKGDSNEYTWLCAIAKNLCYDYFREENRKSDMPDTECLSQENSQIEEDYLKKESSFTIHKILHDLEEPYKEVFELRVFGELSFAEISLIFNKTESWARVTYHRSRLKIIERMESDE